MHCIRRKFCVIFEKKIILHNTHCLGSVQVLPYWQPVENIYFLSFCLPENFAMPKKSPKIKSNFNEFSEDKKENTVDDFFIIDHAPSPVHIDIDSSDKYRKKKNDMPLGSYTLEKSPANKDSSTLPSPSNSGSVKLPRRKSMNQISLQSCKESLFMPICKNIPIEIVIDDDDDGDNDVIVIPPREKPKLKTPGKENVKSNVLIDTVPDCSEFFVVDCTSPISLDVNESVNINNESIKYRYVSDKDHPSPSTSTTTHTRIKGSHSKIKEIATNTLKETNQSDDIIYQGTFSQEFITLKVSGSETCREHLLKTNEIRNTFKRQYSTGDKDINENKKRKSPSHILQKRETDDLDIVEIIRKELNDSGDSEGEQVFKSSRTNTSYSDILDLESSKTVLDTPVIFLTDDTQISSNCSIFVTVTTDDTKDPEKVDLKNTDASVKDATINHVCSDEEYDSDCSVKGYKNSSEDEDNTENIDMDIEEDSDTEINVVVENSDFVPLRGIKLSDLEDDVFINDDMLAKRRNLEILRRWELTLLGESLLGYNPRGVKGSVFTVLSYNVLAQKLIQDNQYLYNGCDSSNLEWPYRWTLLQHEVRHLMPDIMTFQEVQSSHYHTYYLPWFTHLGYKCIYKKRTGDKCDGCAIIFSSDKFKLIEETSVEYFQPRAGKALDRDNIGLIVKLTPTSFNSPFCVATTHILFNPNRGDIKLAQVVMLLTELDRICYEGQEGGRPIYCPVILTGDFNAEPKSNIVNFVRNGYLNYMGLSKKTLKKNRGGPIFCGELMPPILGISEYCQHKVLEQSRFIERTRGSLFSLNDKRQIEEKLIKINHSERPNDFQKLSNSANLPSIPTSGSVSHAFNFKSVYYHKLRRTFMANEVTTFQDGWITVDYIFYTRVPREAKLVEGPLKLIGRYGLLSSAEATKYGPLPSAVCPSDHLPLAAQFLLKPQ